MFLLYPDFNCVYLCGGVWSYPEPLSFSDRVSVLFSDALLTLSLDWLPLSPASAPAADGSFLFFLAKNFLNVWNLDFFFPENRRERMWMIMFNSPHSDVPLTPLHWVRHSIFTHCLHTNSTYYCNYLCISCKGARRQLRSKHTQTDVCTHTWRQIHTLVLVNPAPPVNSHPLAPQWKTQQLFNKSLNSYKLLSLLSVSKALIQSLKCPLVLSPCPTGLWLVSTFTVVFCVVAAIDLHVISLS